MVRQEGWAALWKGNGVTVVHRLPYSAINFWAYERITELWRRHVPTEKSNSSLEFSRRLVAGGLAGAMACTAVRVFLQTPETGNTSTVAEPANDHILPAGIPSGPGTDAAISSGLQRLLQRHRQHTEDHCQGRRGWWPVQRAECDAAASGPQSGHQLCSVREPEGLLHGQAP